MSLAAAMRFLEDLGASVDEAALERHLAARRGSAHGEDLALAFACARGDPAAVRHFEAKHLPAAGRALKKNGFDAQAVEDVLGWLRFELFAREQGPLFGTYSGKSGLDAWLRAIVLHEAMRRGKKQRREVTPEAAAQIPVPEAELAAMRGAYGPHFTRALSESFKALEVAQRNLLRQYFLDGCSIDVLAGLHQVHRATAARRVASAREALVAGVRERLKRALKLSDASVDQVITLSNLEQSLTGLLRHTG